MLSLFLALVFSHGFWLVRGAAAAGGGRHDLTIGKHRSQAAERLMEVDRSQRLLAGFFVAAGTMHFIVPRAYEAMMPPALPRHREAVVVSGIAEIAGGLAVIPPGSRRIARWWLLALLLAVFPANVHMAVNPEQVTDLDLDRLPRWALWARLPLQPLAMLWVWRATRPSA